MAASGNDDHDLCYSAGVMVLSKKHPQVIRYRSPEPVLTPLLPEERRGIIANVVFPTGIDRRDDLGLPDRFDVYYGMADYRIGVARLDLPAAGWSRRRSEKGINDRFRELTSSGTAAPELGRIGREGPFPRGSDLSNPRGRNRGSNTS